jgi:hypothetical protein
MINLKPLNYRVMLLVFLPLFCLCKTVRNEKEVIKIMSYNVLRYGDGCQGTDRQLHGYLKTIVNYASPDILGLVKVEAIKTNTDINGKAPVGFQDSILVRALNASHPGKYACCPFTNGAKDDNQNLLFFNKHKFGFASVVTLVSDVSDFNMYKLYYLNVNLAKTHDTAFLYIVLIHTFSGDGSNDRDRQMVELSRAIKRKFSTLPSIVIMGDLNLRKTNETGYQELINSVDAGSRFTDPPFSIDNKVSYPANWDKHPERFSSYLTTSTRRTAKEPNSCGTGGGAKGWYDHMLLSPSLANGSGGYHYIPRSYHTVGNDGNRINKSVNDLPNTAAQKEVLDALFQMSNKYPVMLELAANNR